MAVSWSLVKEGSDSIQRLSKASTECRARLLQPRDRLGRLIKDWLGHEKGQRLSQATISNMLAEERRRGRGVIWEAGYAQASYHMRSI
jgi:hypothetical protein